MGWFRYKRSSIVPETHTINMRTLLDDSGHLLTFAFQTSVADAAAGSLITALKYEDENHTQIEVAGPTLNLASTDPFASGFGKMDMQLCLDQYWPGAGVFEEINGKFQLEFQLSGSAGSALYSYTLLVSNVSLTPFIDV